MGKRGRGLKGTGNQEWGASKGIRVIMGMRDAGVGVDTILTEAAEEGAEALATEVDLEGLKNMAEIMVDMMVVEATEAGVRTMAGRKLITMHGRAR